jgi:hypothetical protein
LQRNFKIAPQAAQSLALKDVMVTVHFSRFDQCAATYDFAQIFVDSGFALNDPVAGSDKAQEMVT